MAKVTIQNIARELGLSRNTVSMALKGNDLVAPRTREMVLRYARKAGYAGLLGEEQEAPYTSFPGVQAGREDADGARDGEKNVAVRRIMILRKPDVAVYWDKVINGISEEASRNHCQTQVAVVSQEDEEAGRLPGGLEGIQAVFCVKMLNQTYIRQIRQKGIQVYLLDNCHGAGEELPGDVVKTEGFQPVVHLTQHLLDQGMRRIGFLNEGSSLYETMHERYQGYRYAMERAGITPQPEIVMPDVYSDFFYGADTFEKIVDGFRELPEAVVCGNDEIAKFLTQALRRKGIRVPEDIAVTGFDDDEEGMLDPFFTTVHVDVKWLGRRMVQSFLWRQQHPDAPYEKIGVSGQIVIRRSSCRQSGVQGLVP